MKRAGIIFGIFLLALALLAAPVYGATLTLTTTAAADAVIDAERVHVNAQTCVVASVDAASRTLTFTDGRQAQFPPPATDSPAEEPKEEANG